MKKKLILGMTVLFMIIAVIFVACPGDNGGSSAESGEDIDDNGEDLEHPVIKPSLPNPGATLEGDNLELTVNVDGDDAGYKYEWYWNTSDSYEKATLIVHNDAKGKTFKPPTNVGENVYGIPVAYNVPIWYFAKITIPDVEEPLLTQKRKVIVIPNTTVAAKLAEFPLQPQDATYAKDAVLVDKLEVTAEVKDENPDVVGELTYQWWVTTDLNETGEAYGEISEPQPKETPTSTINTIEANCIPDVSKIGVFYYYLVVTNKIEDNGDGGQYKERSSNSEVARIEVKRAAIAQKPTITAPTGGNKLYALNQQDVTSLEVTVGAVPEGDLTYQWYRRLINSNEGGEIVTGASGTVPSNKKVSFRPPVGNEITLWYYFCEATNTINTTPADAVIVGKTASIRSAPVYIGVGITPINLTGLTANNKVFNGSKDATFSGTAGLDLTVPGVTLKGTAAGQFADANTGNNKDVELTGLYIEGDQAAKYRLIIPAYKANITKANGAAVANAPNVGTGATPENVIIKGKNITLMEGVELASNATSYQKAEQRVEYGISSLSNGTNITWKGQGLTITGLSLNTDYFIYARSTASTNFNAGTAVVQTSIFALRTVPGATVGTPTVTSTNVTDSRITANAVSAPANGQTVEYALGTANNTAAGSLTWQNGLTWNGLQGETDYYVYARSKDNSDYYAGAPSVSTAVKTMSPIITFETDGGSMLAAKNIAKGGTLDKASVTGANGTTKNTYTFDAWFTDAAKTNPYDYDTPVTSSFTLYAKWFLTSQGTAMAQKQMVRISSGWFLMGTPANLTSKEGADIRTDILKNPSNNANQTLTDPGVIIGSGKETQHKVGLEGFWICSHEVTQDEWVAVMGAGSNPSQFSSNPASGETQGKRPVDSVSWYAAIAYCNRLSISEYLTPAYKLKNSVNPNDWGAIPTGRDSQWDAVTIVEGSTGYRLPTEAQWEYACRAGTTTQYNTNSNSFSTDIGWYENAKAQHLNFDLANNNGNSGGKTHEWGKKPANPWGLYDMHGNVAEWCWDWYKDDLGSAAVLNPRQDSPINNTVPAAGGSNNGTSPFRVFRGGSWGGSVPAANTSLSNLYTAFYKTTDENSIISTGWAWNEKKDNAGYIRSRFTADILQYIGNPWSLYRTTGYVRSAARSPSYMLVYSFKEQIKPPGYTNTNQQSYWFYAGQVYGANVPIWLDQKYNFMGLRVVRP